MFFLLKIVKMFFAKNIVTKNIKTQSHYFGQTLETNTHTHRSNSFPTHKQQKHAQVKQYLHAAPVIISNNESTQLQTITQSINTFGVLIRDLHVK